MDKYTPGPWKHTCREDLGMEPSSELIHSWSKSSKRRGHPVASVHGPINDENKANARLIAAAPTLLEALKKAEPIIAYSISYYGSDEAIAALRQVRETIAWAEGRS